MSFHPPLFLQIRTGLCRAAAVFLTSVLFLFPAVAVPQAPDVDDIGKSWVDSFQGNKNKGDTADEKNKTQNESPPADAAGEVERAVDSQIQTVQEDPPSFVATLVRFILLMGIMIAGLYLVLRYLKTKSGSIASGNGLMEVIASLPVLPGKNLQIVDVAGKLLILGVSEHGINLVHAVEDARTADKIRIFQSQKKDILPEGFLAEMTELLRKNDLKFWKSSGETGSSSRRDFKKLLRQETGVPEPEKETEDLFEDSAELNDLLMKQRKKIAGLKNKKISEK